MTRSFILGQVAKGEEAKCNFELLLHPVLIGLSSIQIFEAHIKPENDDEVTFFLDGVGIRIVGPNVKIIFHIEKKKLSCLSDAFNLWNNT